MATSEKTPRRNRRVYVEFKRLEDNGAGGFRSYWTDPAAIWAEMLPVKGERSVEHLVTTTRQLWKVTIRWRKDLGEDFRITCDDVPLTVIGEPVDPDGGRRWLTLTCERGVKG